MKKIVFGFLLFAVCSMTFFTTTSCSDKKSADDSLLIDSLAIDSQGTDTLERMISETPMPKAADELFDDFFFNFMARKDVQYSRIVFPLSVVSGNKTTKIEKRQWKRERFFQNQEFYTLFFDDRKQEALQKDTSVNSAIVEKIYLDKRFVKQYVFNRADGKWMMTSVRNTSFAASPNASFLDFYSKFVTDSVFQIESINEELQFAGPDPDNDFATLEGVLLPEQFPSFAPPLPKGMIYNIIYGEPKAGSNTKIFLIEGIANGNQQELLFKRVGGQWKLFKMSI